jgi:NAD(P)-dependent dehydrogenase (short-subunit alcohol dehydrogenase family)
MGLLEGKRALITGGTTGLGLAVAGRFLTEGARVVITGRDLGLGGQTERALGVGARFVAADAADPEAVASSVRAAAAHLGGLDVLVNNAGLGVTARLIDTPLADYDRVMNVNVRGCLLYAQHAYPHLARNRGCMIHIASDAGIWGEQATGLYSVTKAAVIMLGKMLALDGGPDGVRSNVLCPGDIWPGMRHMAPPGEQASTKQDRAESGDDWPVPPIGRIGQPGDVAAAAVFYASGQSEFITGTTLLIDGGMTAGYLQRERGADYLELLARAVCSGAVAVEAGSDDGSTNVLPPGPACTAWCRALPRRYWGQLRNHSVQPLSQVPPLGLPTIVMGSPGTASS